MIDLYTWNTPNGHKGRIALEECGQDYSLHPINLEAKAADSADFAKISPSQRIPTVVDSDGPGGKPITLFESGVILAYYAEKTGNGMYSTDPLERLEIDEWHHHGQSTFATTVNQLAVFESRIGVDLPPAKDWYRGRTERLYRTLDNHLASRDYLACGRYTIADVAHFTYVNRWRMQKVDLGDYPNVKRWYDRILARPAVQRGIAIIEG